MLKRFSFFPFRGDDVLFHRIGHGVGEKHLVHSVLEFAGTDRFSPLRKIEIMALLNFDTAA